jgi:hypothetical protein
MNVLGNATTYGIYIFRAFVPSRLRPPPLGTADRDVVVLRGNAQRQADQTRDEGDAERNRIFAEAYGRTRISCLLSLDASLLKLD